MGFRIFQLGQVWFYPFWWRSTKGGKIGFVFGKGANRKNPFVFDGPSTGLHFHDINKLLKSLQALINLGHSVIVIEHPTRYYKICRLYYRHRYDAGKHGGEVVLQEL